jgi:hypothetical protein
VQHKNIAETLLSDLETLDAMLSMQGSMMPETDFRPMISVGKRHFLRHLYIKCMILPRQARDKHMENSNKEWRFVRSGRERWRRRSTSR